MKLPCRDSLLLLALACLCSCTIETDKGSLADAVMQLPFPAEQRARAQVIEDFADKNAQAIQRHTELWWSNSSRQDAQSKEERIVLVTIAGELLLRDQRNRARYYEYILKNSRDSDEDVVNVAVWALGNGRDADSRADLFRFLVDPRGLVSSAASESLQFRYASQYGSASPDKLAIEKLHKKLCAPSGQKIELCTKGLVRVR